MTPKSIYTKRWKDKNPEKVRAARLAWYSKPKNRMRHLLSQAKRRAEENGVIFEISIEDFGPLPTHCPVLGIELNYGRSIARGFINNRPSVDRVDPSLGYLKGNVRVISWRANRLKSDATVQELRSILDYMERASPCN